MHRRILFTICFIAGALAPYLAAAQALTLLAALTIAVAWSPSLHNRRSICLLVLSLTVGLSRSGYDLSQSCRPLPGKVSVEGSILDPPRRWGNSSVFLLQVERLDGESVSNDLKLLVRWSRCEQTLEPGDRWALEGRTSVGEPPEFPGGFDQRRWLWCQGASGMLAMHQMSVFRYLGPPRGWSPRSSACRLRHWMMKKLRVIPGEAERALVAGVVFGETAGLPAEIQKAFQRTGTTHLLAASGMNVVLLAGLITMLGRRCGLAPWRLASVCLPPVIFYAFLAGCSPSIVRASLATSLALVAATLGRKSCPWNSLCLSVGGLVLWDPRQLFDLGFQLSSIAVIGLILSPKPPKAWGTVGSAAFLTSSATLSTLPIMWANFGQLSLTLLPANLLLGPLVETLFPLGLLLSAAPLKPLAFLVTWLAKASLFLVEALAGCADPWQLAPPSAMEWLLWLAACLLWFGPESRKRQCCSFLVLGLAFALNYQLGIRPTAGTEMLLIRRCGTHNPVYWVSVSRREILILSKPYQERRARDMLHKLGCLTTPEVQYLPAGLPLQLTWREFEWSRVEPLLLGAPYTEVRVQGLSYRVSYWWPPEAPSAKSRSIRE